MTVELEHDGSGKLTLQISVWLKLAVSVLLACLAAGSAYVGHVASVAHHDQSVDDAIVRLDAAVVEIRLQETVNSEARIRAVEELRDVNEKLDRIQTLQALLLKKQRDRPSPP